MGGMAEVIGIIIGLVLGGWLFNAAVYAVYKDSFEEQSNGDPITALFRLGRFLALIPFGLVTLLCFIFMLLFLGLVIGGIAMLFIYGVGGLVQFVLKGNKS